MMFVSVCILFTQKNEEEILEEFSNLKSEVAPELVNKIRNDAIELLEKGIDHSPLKSVQEKPAQLHPKDRRCGAPGSTKARRKELFQHVNLPVAANTYGSVRKPDAHVFNSVQHRHNSEAFSDESVLAGSSDTSFHSTDRSSHKSYDSRSLSRNDSSACDGQGPNRSKGRNSSNSFLSPSAHSTPDRRRSSDRPKATQNLSLMDFIVTGREQEGGWDGRNRKGGRKNKKKGGGGRRDSLSDGSNTTNSTTTNQSSHSDAALYDLNDADDFPSVRSAMCLTLCQCVCFLLNFSMMCISLHHICKKIFMISMLSFLFLILDISVSHCSVDH
jgi:hypothetical protein